MPLARKFPRVRAVTKRGYSNWFVARRFWLECCDCSLVHQFQFKIIDGKPAFRCRRANGYTARQRKIRNRK